MKLLSVVLVVLASSIAIVLSTHHASAAAPNYGFGTCNSVDENYFPYGFLCGGDPNDHHNVTITGGPSDGRILQGTTSINFNVKYNASDRARTKPASQGGSTPPVMVWVAVDINNDQFAGFTGITGGGDDGLNCPGAGNNPHVVYNFQDNKHGTVPNDHDASPSAWVSGPPGGKGYETCQSMGQMIFWVVDGNTRNFDENFTLHINQNSASKHFCVRESVSVSYGGVNDGYPGNNVLFPRGSGNGVYDDEGNVASRVAKQSVENQCYDVYNDPPTGEINILSCDTYSVKANDPNHDGSPVQFRVIHFGGGQPVVDIPASPSLVTSKSDTTVRSHHWNTKTYYTMEVLDPDDGQWYKIFPPSKIDSCGPPPPGGNNGFVYCDHYSRGLQAHSEYRVTTFPRAAWYLLSSPSPTSHVSRGGWAGLSSSGDHQTDGRNDSPDNFGINTNNDYWDGVASYNSTLRFLYIYLPPPSGPDRMVFVENWHHNVDGANGEAADGTWSYSTDTDTVTNCFSANCTITGIDGPIEAGKPFTVHVNVANTGFGPLPENVAGYHMTLTGTANSDFARSAPMTNVGNLFPIDPGESYDMEPFQQTAPTAKGNYLLEVYPDYYGRFGLGPPCSIPIQVNEYFEIEPHAAINATNSENPTTVTYKTGGHKKSGPDITATHHSWLTFQSAGGSENTVNSPPDSTHTYGPDPADESFNYNPPTIKAGDKYCPYITINPAKGYIDPSGAIIDPQPSTVKGTCLTVHNEPYIHALNGDVSAGGGFAGSSCNLAGGIHTYLTTTGVRPVGSGVQIGALAIGPITGFSSAILRGAAPTGSMGLTFANNSAPGSGPGAPNLGGNMGGTNCVTDYFSGKLPDVPAVPVGGNLILDGSNPTPGKPYRKSAWYKPPAGPLTLESTTLENGVNLTVYVEGDVVINGDITYANTSWGNLDDIPSLRIITKGNIYIEPGVHQLDGLFVAQPGGSGGGDIYTCSLGTSPVGVAAMYTTCNSQLLVNGAFVSQHVYLSRSYGSLRYSQSGESLGSHPTCGSEYGATPYGDCAAEIFNFTPELFFAQPAEMPETGPATGKYDYITSLSPVL